MGFWQWNFMARWQFWPYFFSVRITWVNLVGRLCGFTLTNHVAFSVHKLCWAPFNIIKMKFQCQTSPSLWQHKLLVWYKYVVIAIMYGVNMVTNITNVQYKCCPKVSFDCKWSSKNLLYANIMVATPNMLMFYFWVHLDPHLSIEHLIQYSCWVWASILGLKPNIWFKNGTESSSEIICMATSL